MGWSELLNNGDFFDKKRYHFRKQGSSEIVMAANEIDRLDIIAKRGLGSKEYSWMIAEINNIMDPINEVTQGKVLKIPFVSDISEISNTLDNAITVNNPDTVDEE